MTATERLRQLLDERGVEWGGALTDLSRQTHWSTERNWCAFTEWNDAVDIADTLTVYHVTPEQAVEATLGRGTCRKVRAWEDDPRGGGGWVLVCSECDELLANDGEDGEFDGPNYCPNCGRRVEKWRKESSA